MVARMLEPLYGFRSLLRFKRKFAPVERTMHLCYADPVDLPAIGLAVAGCYLPGFRLTQLPAVLRRR
jgi:phosphatidylglycerol lysyltransferase